MLHLLIFKNRPRDSNSTYAIIKAPKKRWKENKMIPKPPPKREPIIVDYLLERRVKRENRADHINERGK